MTRLALVVVPFFLAERHLRLAGEMLASVKTRYPLDTLAMINAFRSEADLAWLREKFAHVEPNDRNNLSRAWNKGIRLAFERGADYVIVANADLVFHPLCIDNLVACAQAEPDAVIWSTARWHDPITFERARLEPRSVFDFDWSCFMVDRRLFAEVGEFDEGFNPAYFEDLDMTRRIILANRRSARCRAALILHREAGTIRGLIDCADDEVPGAVEFLKRLRGFLDVNEARYARKWGGGQSRETFTVPFNGLPEDPPNGVA
jgi:GT2 family glycosyltransferase